MRVINIATESYGVYLSRKRRDIHMFYFIYSYCVVQYFSSSFFNNFYISNTLVVASSIYHLTPCTNPYLNLLNQMYLGTPFIALLLFTEKY